MFSESALMRGAVSRLMRRDLRRAFRRICWAGPLPELPERPVVLVSNHNSYWDGHLLWLVATHMLGRAYSVWMREWDRFPFFSAIGALPFPADSPARRGASIRITADRFADNASAALAWFPDGAIYPAEHAGTALPLAQMVRIHKVLGNPIWLPVAIHVTWRAEALPTALLAGARSFAEPTAEMGEVLRGELGKLARNTDTEERALLRGAAGDNERWNFSFMARLFRPVR